MNREKREAISAAVSRMERDLDTLTRLEARGVITPAQRVEMEFYQQNIALGKRLLSVGPVKAGGL